MATDSSSGTLPPSSRVTMVSSSSIARSKLSFLTSIWVSSAISLSRDAPLRRRGFTDNFTKLLWRDLSAHQCRDMCRGRLLEALQIIAAFEYRDTSATGALVGDVHQFARDPAEIFRLEIERRSTRLNSSHPS